MKTPKQTTRSLKDKPTPPVYPQPHGLPPTMPHFYSTPPQRPGSPPVSPEVSTLRMVAMAALATKAQYLAQTVARAAGAPNDYEVPEDAWRPIFNALLTAGQHAPQDESHSRTSRKDPLVKMVDAQVKQRFQLATDLIKVLATRGISDYDKAAANAVKLTDALIRELAK
jgi:hypothetical protein